VKSVVGLLETVARTPATAIIAFSISNSAPKRYDILNLHAE
jgi:hypothetical protein